MTRRGINTALHASAVLFAAASLFVLALGVMLPLQSRREAPDDPREPRASADAASLPTLASLESIWAIRLQNELSPQQAQLAAVAPQEPSSSGQSVPVSLVGTIGDSLAILRGTSGAVEVRAMGEVLDGVEIVSIRPARVQVRFNGEVTTLTKAGNVE